jgi:hypothetical protein
MRITVSSRHAAVLLEFSLSGGARVVRSEGGDGERQAEHDRDNDPGQPRLGHSLPAAPALGKKSCSPSILYSAMVF